MVLTFCFLFFSIGDLLIDFGRSPFWNCPAPEDPTATSGSVTVPTVQRKPTTEVPWSSLEGNSVGSNTKYLAKNQPPPTPSTPAVLNRPPWYIPAIECNEPENHVFYAHLGPTGGSQGYNAITGFISLKTFAFNNIKEKFEI